MEKTEFKFPDEQDTKQEAKDDVEFEIVRRYPRSTPCKDGSTRPCATI